jgi:hypothetical protein
MPEPPRHTDEQPRYTEALHVAALWCFAVGGPVLALLAANSEMLVAHRIVGTQIALLLWAVLWLPPLLWLALQGIVAWVAPGLRGALQTAAVACLSWLGLLMAWHAWLGSSAPALLGIATACTLLWLRCYSRYAVARQFVTLLGFSLVLMPFVYLYASPLARLRLATLDVAYAPLAAKTPVVVLIFDELPLVSLLGADHHIEARLYPNFGWLQRHANWYRNATAVADTTLQCVPAILSGSYPRSEAMPLLSEYPHNLFTFLGGSYDMRVHESVTSLCPLDESRLPERVHYSRFARDLAVLYLLEVLPQTWSAGLADVLSELNVYGVARQIPRNYEAPQKAARRPQIFRDFVDSMQGGNRTLHVLHVILPHVPWLFLPDGRSYATPEAPIVWNGPVVGRWGDDEGIIASAWQRHLLQVQFIDSLLGEMMARMRELGLYDRCVFVVVADHGECFRGGHDRRRLQRGNADEILPVPLFIKLPNQTEGRIDDSNVQTIDVLPTIAQAIGAPLPWRVDGRGLLGGEPEPADKQAANRENARFRLPARLSVDEPLRRKLGLFGDAGERLYRCSPRPDLIGRAVSSFTVMREGSETVEVADAEDFDDVAPDSDYMPCWIRGRVSAFPAGGERGWRGTQVAVAVNGVIRAETPLHDDSQGGGSFSAMVAPTSFRRGANRVDCFVVRGGAKVQLQPLPRASR